MRMTPKSAVIVHGQVPIAPLPRPGSATQTCSIRLEVIVISWTKLRANCSRESEKILALQKWRRSRVTLCSQKSPQPHSSPRSIPTIFRVECHLTRSEDKPPEFLRLKRNRLKPAIACACWEVRRTKECASLLHPESPPRKVKKLLAKIPHVSTVLMPL